MPSDQWIEIADFSPGIYGDIHGGTTGALLGKNGAATISGTYGCCVDPFGALVPLPKATTALSSQLIPSGNGSGTTAFYPTGMIAAYLVDAITFGPYSTSFAWAPTVKNLEGQVVHACCWFFMFAPAGGSTAYRAMYLCRLYANGGSKDILWDSSYPTTYTTPQQISSMSVTAARQAVDPSLALVTANFHNAIVVAIGGDVYHGGGTAYTIPADERTLSTWGPDMFDRLGANYTFYPSKVMDGVTGTGRANDNGYWLVWPNPGTTGSDRFNLRDFAGQSINLFPQTFAPLASSGRPIMVLSHQGRTVCLEHRLMATGNSLASQTTFLAYSGPFTPVVGANVNQTFFGENNSDSMVIASLNTDELLVIRNSDGAVILRGDIDNPTVVKLRNLESTFGVAVTPINTPLGLVYGSPNGVFVYAGGEVAQKISEQLEGFFWDHKNTGDQEYEANRGRFGHFHHWIAVPNNFIFDERSQSWWRLTDPADRNGIAYNCYTSDPTSGDLFAFPYKLTPAQNVICDRFTKETLNSSYTWTSQPLVETLERTQSFQEVMIVASPGLNTNPCTVSVQVSGYDGNGVALTPITVQTTFTGTGNGSPVIKRLVISSVSGGNFNAMYVQVRVTASASAGPAPKLLSLRLGHADRSRNPRS